MTELIQPNLEFRYAALPTLSWSTFKKGSLLDWGAGNFAKRDSFFKSTTSFEEALEKIQKRYPQVQLIRGGGLANPMGDFGDFFVGNIDAALRYTAFDVNQNKRDFPIIVHAPLIDVLFQMRQGTIEPYGPWRENAARLTQSGVMNLKFPSKDGLGIFTLEKPPVDRRSPKNLWNHI